MGHALALALWLLVAAATPPRLRLTYDAAGTCPDVAAVKARVRAEVGGEVFDDASPRGVTLVIRATPSPDGQSSLAGEIEYRDESGARDGWRRLESPRGDCDELIRGFALLTALHLQLLETPPARAGSATAAPIDEHIVPTRPPLTARPIAAAPSAVAPQRPPVAPPLPIAPTPPIAPMSPAPPGSQVSDHAVGLSTGAAAATPSPWAWSPGAGLLAHTGLSPRLVPGLRAELMARRSRFTVAAGIDLLGITGAPGAQTAFDMFAGLGWVSVCVAPIAQVRLRFEACPFAAAGLVSIRGVAVDRPRADTGILLHLGLEGRLSLAIYNGWGVSLVAAGVHDPTPWSVQVDGLPRWSSPAWSARAGLLLHRSL